MLKIQIRDLIKEKSLSTYKSSLKNQKSILNSATKNVIGRAGLVLRLKKVPDKILIMGF